MTNRILIRADDLGYCEAVNYGIEKAVRSGLIRSVGLMPNLPAAAHGVALLQGLDVCWGQHTNLCLGKPLTDPAKIPSLVDENGLLKTTKIWRSQTDAFAKVEEMELEIEAQYLRFVELTGRKPSYFEGHAVFGPRVDAAFCAVAERYGLDYLPASFTGPAKFGRMRLRTVLESQLPDYDPLRTLQKAVEADCPEGTIPMLILHPGYVDAFLLRTSMLTTARAWEVELAESGEGLRYLKERNVRIVNYDEVK